MSNIIRKSNNKSSRSNIILIEIDGNAKEYLSDVEKWIINCLENLKDNKNFSKIGDSRFIINILNEDFFGSTNKKEKIIVLFQNGDNPGPLLESTFDNDNIVFNKEYDTENYLLAEDILNILVNEPKYIKKIGVSSISKKCMIQFWDDMTCNNPLSFKIPIKLLEQKMWLYIEEKGWFKYYVCNSDFLKELNLRI